jgi:MinD-like ATPase involved in chromosome partitioning or flagellar assembly
MTDLSTIPTWPTIQAITRPDGTGELTINGTSYPIQAATVHEARNEIIRRVTDTASKLGQAVHLATTGPEGQFPIVVHPDGQIEPDTTQQTTPTRARSSQPTEPPAGSPVEQLADPTTPPAPASPATPARTDQDLEQHGSQRAPDTAPYNPPAEVARGGHSGAQRLRKPSTASVAGSWGQEPALKPSEAPQRAAHAASGHDISPAAEPPRAPVARRSFLTQEQTEEPATQGWRGFLTRIGIRLAPSTDERKERADVRAVSQHWPGPRTIAVVNGKGGASKTPSTILLSAVFARYGGAGVLAWDNNQTRGTLGWRTEQGPHEATLLDLLPQAEHLLSTSAQSADLAHFVHHQTRDRFDVLRSQPMVLADQQRVEPADVDAIWRVAAKYYRLILLDSGNDEADPMWLRMIDHTDQLVVVTTTRDDHAEAGALLLEALAQRDQRSAQLAEQAVAIVSQADPKARPEELRDIATGYRTLAREVVTIPHDPAMVDGLLRYGSLRPTTQRAWLAAGAAVARGLHGLRQ